ncbi:MAG: GGDEF domain-containing protein [Lachnospiraceae bacterium]
MQKIESMAPGLRQFCELGQLFDFYRLIQPTTRKVYDYSDGTLKSQDQLCYRDLDRFSPCINCVASRACRDQKTYMKLECIQGRSYLIYAVPAKINGDNYALELLKDVTGSMAIPNNVHVRDNCMAAVVQKFNNLAALDSLTGLYNKDYILQKMEAIIAAKKPEDFMFGTLIDIQQLKKINELYGIGAGDLVIRKIADLLKVKSREQGYLTGRFSGDEFICFFPVKDEAEGMERCRKMEEQIGNILFEFDGKQFQVNVTIYGGLYQDGLDCGRFLTYLDNRLYAEKQRRHRPR